MKKLLMMFTLLTLASLALAQVSLYATEELNQFKGLGVHFGTVSASGFSYRFFSHDQGLQLTLGGITLGSKNINDTVYDDYGTQNTITLTEEGRRTNFNLGLNYLYTLANNRTGRFYVFAGGSYLYSRVNMYDVEYSRNTNGYYYYRTNTPEREWHKNRNYYYLGTGLGFDFNLGQNFHWALELPLTMNQDQEFMMYIPQTGLYYYFK